ncbi:hypothetical protein GCM10007108_12770 [Thermogymnomonas acidicola]|uniref:Uncharacterized protein n=1 Tax=Thermogymnomonas acidicola TaxID=399579 RepID=A0AA37BRX7_9ARCH|nr:hypothetical protein [Thermogymnomonas acidicola]GGM76236.1 hypothetical protein GCM10007108_12770 [Thermogymnomonas acidicola]
MVAYDCSKIRKITVIYAGSGPGSFAGEKYKVIEGRDAQGICEVANQLGISIEQLLKRREKVEAVVINRDVSLPKGPAQPHGHGEQAEHVAA